MYAIVDIAGQQFRVEKDQKIFVHRLEGKAGSKLDFNKVMLIDNNQNVTVGSPVIEGAMVYASIIDHLKGDKIIVFKKKRRKGYRVKNGHRQYLTQILIEDIIEKGAKARVAVKEIKPVIKKETKKIVVAPKTDEITVKKKVVKEPVAKTLAEKKPAPKVAVKKTSKPELKVAAEKKTESKAAVKKTSKPAVKAPVKKKPAAKTTEKKTTKPAAKTASAKKKEPSKKSGSKTGKK